MRPQPKFSVVTITYNDKSGLERTIESVRAQSYANFEHHIVDGLSTDGAADVALKYAAADSRVIFTSEADRGIFHAMNKGAWRSSGDLLVFLNSGDIFSDSDVLRFVSRQWVLDDEWRWGFGAQRHVNASGTPIRASVVAPFNRRKFELGLQFVPHPASYVERTLFVESGGFDEAFGTAADQEIFFRFVRVHRPAVWVRFLCDFLEGGVHTSETVWSREWLWHRMRVKNDAAFGGSNWIDAVMAAAFALARGARRVAGRLARSSG